MSDNSDEFIQSDNPIANLSHDQKIQFVTARCLSDLRPLKRNATAAIFTSEFDIPKQINNLDNLDQ